MMPSQGQGLLDFGQFGPPSSESCLAVIPAPRPSAAHSHPERSPKPKGPSLQEQAATIRASADLAAVARELAARPAAADITAIPNYDLTLFLKGMPPEPSRQAKYLEAGLAEANRLVREQSVRYDTVRQTGLAAISDFDLVMGHSSTDPLYGLWFALRTLGNHVTYGRSMAAAITKKLTAL